jgi:hypothetical protein
MDDTDVELAFGKTYILMIDYSPLALGEPFDAQVAASLLLHVQRKRPAWLHESERTLIAEAAKTWIDVAKYDKEIQPADSAHLENTIIIRDEWPQDSETRGQTKFNAQAHAVWPVEYPSHGIPTDRWGTAFRDTLTTGMGSGDPFSNRRDFTTAAVHEFGHLIGLDDVHRWCASTSVMTKYFILNSRSSAPSLAAPTKLDREAIKNLSLKR